MPTRPGPVTEDYSEDLSEDRISPAAGIRHGYRRPSQHQSQRSDAQTPERISVGGRLTACCQLGSTEEERDARQSTPRRAAAGRRREDVGLSPAVAIPGQW